jgi:hypothetical protein
MIGTRAISLPTELIYCLQEGDHEDNERPFLETK